MSLKNRQKKEKELEKCKELLRTPNSNKQEIERHMLTLQRQTEIDKEETRRTNEELQAFLVDAIQNYTNCLIHGIKYDVTAIFRLCSLW